MIRFVLLDIEGTISDINFVRTVLFPFSARELPAFIERNKTNAAVMQCLKDTGAASDEAAVTQLLEWIAKDVKHPALKTLQGLIWREGYESGAFRAHLYPDVIPTLTKWRMQNIRLGIYSSGSIAAQLLFFQYSEMGDVRAYLEAYFDLSTGGKRDQDSYTAIAAKLDLSPDDILFLSDVSEELDAARAAGFTTGLIVRGAQTSSLSSPASKHPTFTALSEIGFS